MKKLTLLIGIIFLINIVILNGCTENTNLLETKTIQPDDMESPIRKYFTTKIKES